VKVVFQNGAMLSVEEALEKKKLDIPGCIEKKVSQVFLSQSGLLKFAVFVSSVIKF